MTLRHVTFVRPNLGFGPSADALEPLAFAILKARTPKSIATTVIDERIEPFAPVPTDLAAITVETFTARRAYEIADVYRARGVPVVMGGHHPSLAPDEALRHADAVVVGDAEGAWERVLEDAAAGALERRYEGGRAAPGPVAYDRSAYADKTYAGIQLVQAGRGCRFACDFCSIHAFYGVNRAQREPDEVAAEIAALPKAPMIFFVDDNLYLTKARFVALMRALAPLKRRWSCQVSIDVARDDTLIDLMAEAGCALVLIGFESLDPAALKQMRKNWSHVAGGYADVVARLHARAIMVYAGFVFGYDGDTPASFDAAAAFAGANALAIANFNPLTPTPGTELYRRLRSEGRLLKPEWWTDPDYRYGDAIFSPRGMTPDELAAGPMRARAQFYGWRSILARAAKGALLWRDPAKVGLMLLANAVSRREIRRKQFRALSRGAR